MAEIRDFGATAAGERVQAIRLSSGTLTAVLLTRGAVLQDVRIEGTPWSLTLGGESLGAYEGPMEYFGSLVGPVANRIGRAETRIAGKTFRFRPNDGPNLLHSGETGLHSRIWEIADTGAASVTLRVALPDGLGGFPGNREVVAGFAVEGASLTMTLTATTDAPTLMNIANHSYWSLDGAADYRGHRLRIAAERYLPLDSGLVPTGEIRAVSGLRDFREGREPGLGEAIDCNFCLCDAPRELSFAGELTGRSGLRMTVETTEPGLQVYDGARLGTAPWAGHGGRPYGPYAGIAIEAQRWPDAPAHAGFPPIALAPGETYRQVTRWSFGRA